MNNINLIKNSVKSIKYYFKKKLNKIFNNVTPFYIDINKIQKPYFGAGNIECHFKINYKFDKLSDEWKQFKKILIEENFYKRNIDNTIEINILKNIFLDKILSIFN